MKRIFSKLSIGQRIAVAVIIPVFSVLILSTELAYKDYKNYAKTDQLASGTVVCPHYHLG